MGGFTKIRLKDKSQSNIDNVNAMLGKAKIIKEYRFYSEKNVKQEYKYYLKGDGHYPEHLFPANQINSYDDFKSRWSAEALGEVFVPKFGTLTFDCYYDRTPERVMNQIAKFLIKNIYLIGEVEGSFSTFVEKCNLNQKDKQTLLSLEDSSEPEMLPKDEQYHPETQSGMFLCKSFSLEPFWIIFGNVKRPSFMKEKIYKDDLYNNIYRDKKGYAYMLIPPMPINNNQYEWLVEMLDHAQQLGLREHPNFIASYVYKLSMIDTDEVAKEFKEYYTKDEIIERFNIVFHELEGIHGYNMAGGFVWSDKEGKFIVLSRNSTIQAHCDILNAMLKATNIEDVKLNLLEEIGF